MLLVIVVSLAAPMQKSMCYFKVASFVYGILILSSLFGVAYLVLSQGFYPEYKKLVGEGADAKWVVQTDNGLPTGNPIHNP